MLVGGNLVLRLNALSLRAFIEGSLALLSRPVFTEQLAIHLLSKFILPNSGRPKVVLEYRGSQTMGSSAEP